MAPRSSDRQRRLQDIGLLIIRVGLGLSFIAHGAPKLTGGPDSWTRVGSAMSVFGITFAPAAWGLAAALSEALGGLLVAVGLFVRPACAALAFTMFVAFSMHVSRGDGFRDWSHAAEVGVVFLGLLLVGAGRFSLDHLWRGRR